MYQMRSAESLQVVTNRIWSSNVKASGLTKKPAVRLHEIPSLVTQVLKRLHELAKIGVVITECDALNDSVVARCMVFFVKTVVADAFWVSIVRQFAFLGNAHGCVLWLERFRNQEKEECTEIFD